MLVHPGTSDLVVSETTVGAGTTSRIISIQSDQALISYWVDSIVGSLTVRVYSQVDDDKEELVLTLGPTVAPTTAIVSDLTGAVNARLRIEATYTGACTYQIYIRAMESGVSGGGGSSGSESVITSYSVDNVSVPTANTEVPIVVPTTAVWIQLYNRTDGLTKLAFTLGDSGTLYSTINPGDCHEYMKKSGVTMTLYVQCPKAGQTIEVTYGHQ